MAAAAGGCRLLLVAGAARWPEAAPGGCITCGCGCCGCWVLGWAGRGSTWCGTKAGRWQWLVWMLALLPGDLAGADEVIVTMLLAQNSFRGHHCRCCGAWAGLRATGRGAAGPVARASCCDARREHSVRAVCRQPPACRKAARTCGCSEWQHKESGGRAHVCAMRSSAQSYRPGRARIAWASPLQQPAGSWRQLWRRQQSLLRA